MNPHDAALQELLKRTYLTLSFDTFLPILVSQYQSIGTVLSYHPITEGYEAANIFLTTSNGQYVLKIFESIRSKKNISELVQILVEAPKVGVPAPRLVEGKDGFLSCYVDSGHEVYFYLTEFFDGANFDKKVPTLDEMIHVSDLLAKLNTLDFEVEEEYDSWGNKNLVKEYQLNEKNLSGDVKNIIFPIVSQMKVIDMSSFSKAVIHGDMQRKHVLKNIKNEFCILDFGCARTDYKVYDLSTYLAWFCLSHDTWAKKDEIFEKVIQKYTFIHNLSEKELKSIPLLVQAAYASYYLKTTLLIQEGDLSEETKKWHNDSMKMLSY